MILLVMSDANPQDAYVKVFRVADAVTVLTLAPRLIHEIRFGHRVSMQDAHRLCDALRSRPALREQIDVICVESPDKMIQSYVSNALGALYKICIGSRCTVNLHDVGIMKQETFGERANKKSVNG